MQFLAPDIVAELRANLEAQRDLLDVRDVARAYRLLMARGDVGEAYNVALGQPTSMRAALDRLRPEMGGCHVVPVSAGRRQIVPRTGTIKRALN